MMKKRLLIASILLVALVVWGIIGGKETSNPGRSCNIGVESVFCLKWQTANVVSSLEFEQEIDNFLDPNKN